MTGPETLTWSLDVAAVQAGVSKRTLQYEIAAGRLDSIKVGRRRLIAPDALRAWLEARRAEGGNEQHVMINEG